MNMATMFDYIQWRGDLTFVQDPLNAVDALIFSTLSYIRYGGAVEHSPDQPMRLRDAAEAFFAQYSPEDAVKVVESIHAINDIDFVSAVMAMVERVAAMVLHLELSVVVFAAVRMKKYWMYPLAILLHAGVDFLAGLYQAGVTDIWVMEALILAYVAALTVPVYRLYKSMPTDKAPKLDKFGRDPRLGLI